MTNRVELVGRLGKDAESRSFQNGGQVTNLRVATSERYKDKQGEWQERTEWHAVQVWGEKDAEALADAKKGDEVLVIGSLTTRKWQDQSGKDQYSTEVSVQFPKGLVRILRPRNGSGGTESGGQSGAGRSGGWDSGGGGGAGRGGGGGSSSRKADLDDDIPFAAEWR